MESSGGSKGRGVSVIVPTYNEADVIEGTLEHLHAALRKLDRPFEILVADDGSRDDTLALVHSMSKFYPEIRSVTQVVNLGKGAAVRNGFAHARMPIVGYVDADIRPEATTLMRYLAALDDGHDIVLANKWDRASKVEYTFSRRVASYGYGLFAKAFFWIPVVDTQCGFKFFDRRLLEKAVPHLRVDRFGFDVELLAWCLRHGGRIVALPIEIREIRASKVHSIDVLKMLKDLIAVRMRMWKRPRAVVEVSLAGAHSES